VARGHRDTQLLAGVVAMAGWAALGVALLAAAWRRARLVIRRHEALLAEGDRLLAAEDEAARAAPATMEGSSASGAAAPEAPGEDAPPAGAS
jgi:hypothetical protein